MSHLNTVEEVAGLIKAGKILLLAGDEELLKQLPKGTWIAGTIPYFMDVDGGIQTADKIFVNDITNSGIAFGTKMYSVAELPSIPRDCPDDGVSYLILPGMSEAHLKYALEAPSYDGMYLSPIIGWIAGINLSYLGKISPKVVDGRTGEISDNKAAVLSVTLKPTQMAEIDIINLFRQGGGDTLMFEEPGFSTRDVLVNGQKQNFAGYIKSKGIDIRYPLVADYNGVMVNISFQSVDEENQRVNFYAPIFKGVEYKIAENVGDYVTGFGALLPKNLKDGDVVFSCNCILNYLYAELEGKKTAGMNGPITFGEVAYQLLNQTLVYVRIIDK